MNRIYRNFSPSSHSINPVTFLLGPVAESVAKDVLRISGQIMNRLQAFLITCKEDKFENSLMNRFCRRIKGYFSRISGLLLNPYYRESVWSLMNKFYMPYQIYYLPQ